MGSIYFLPMVAAKLMRKKIVYFISGLAGRDANRKTMRLIYKQTLFGLGGSIFSTIISNLEELNYNLADLIVVESPNLARQISSNEHYNKPILNGSLFVNIELFCPRISLSNRTNIVSYFGALNEHKGIKNFIAAIPLILNAMDDFKFVIGGMGPAFEEIKKDLKIMQIIEKVDLCGNIPHENISDYLNKTRLVVLPSYGEGLPNIVLEAMACGTPVLATPVGGIPDVIKDGVTGFLMESNSPECIAANVVRSLEHSDLEGIAQRARALVEREYTFESAVKRWRKVLEECGR
jgi:glycosyltransferase involved in cell wall biosynthesis